MSRGLGPTKEKKEKEKHKKVLILKNPIIQRTHDGARELFEARWDMATGGSGGDSARTMALENPSHFSWRRKGMAAT